MNETIKKRVLNVSIVHPSVKKIPLNEVQEELVDVLAFNDPRILSMGELDIKYACDYEGYTQVRLNVYKKLLKMLEILPKHLGIAFFEGYRPLYKQKEYFDTKFKEQFKKHQNKEIAYVETCKYVSPFIDNIPTHATGAAIDISLFEVEKKQLLDLGEFDCVVSESDLHETFSPSASITQKKNRSILLEAAIIAGFANYGYEWWHYSYGDKVHAKVYDLPYAIYGLADKEDSILSMTKDQYFAKFPSHGE